MGKFMDDLLLQRYSRHILLDDIGIEGQQKLLAAKILIIGAGGLGCPAALYLAAAGVGEIVLYDDDVVDLTNLQRQTLHNSRRIGMPKTYSAQLTLADINPNCRITTRRQKFTANDQQALSDIDIIVDCCDNYGARHATNRLCAQNKIPLIFGAASGFDGQMAVFDSRLSTSPCYNCLFSENDEAPEERCALTGVFAPLTGIIGCMQAAAAIKLIAAPSLSTPGILTLIEAKQMTIRAIRIPRDSACAVCSPSLNNTD